MNAPPRLIMSASDARRLEALLASEAMAHPETAALLEREIARADIREAPNVPDDVVRMESDVVMLDEATGTQRQVRLVFPHETAMSPQAVSVLAPVGAALIGLSVGDAIDWPLPGGRSTRLRVLSIVHGAS